MDWTQYYTVTHPNETTQNWASFYSKVIAMTKDARNKLHNRLNINYAADNDPKHTLDLYFPIKAKNAPVYIFLHGGGFREGTKDEYGYVAIPFSTRKVITVVPNYSWAPERPYPSQIDDIRDVLSWIYHNIGSMGGDPTQIYLGGHSAGAIITASVALDSSWKLKRGLPIDVVKGCFPISGWYDLRKFIKMELIGLYFSDPSSAEAASPILNINTPPQDNLIAVGDKETVLLEPSKNLVEQLSKKGVRAKLLVLEGLDHADTALALGDIDGTLVQEILKIIWLAG